MVEAWEKFADPEIVVGEAVRAALGPVFPDRHGGYRDRNNIEADYRKVRKGTAFEWVVPHVYRKTVATMLDQAA